MEAASDRTFNARIQTFNARFDLRAGRANLISGGYEFESENFKNPSFPVDPTANSNVVVTQTSHTLFVQDQLRFMDDRLQISAAFRAQFFRLRQPVFTPSASSPYAGLTFLSPPTAYTGDGSVAYMFRSTGTKLRAHVGNGYRAPSLYERFGSFFDSFFGFSPIGDPRLKPDRSIAFDAGIDQTLYKNRLRASATYFYTRLQQVITFDFSGAINPTTDPFGRFGGYRNSNGGIARGIELSLTAAATRTLNASASYTYTKSLQRTPQVPGVLRSLVIPDHQFSLVVTQRFGRRVLVNFDLGSIERLSGSDLRRVSPAGLTVFRTGKGGPRSQLHITVKRITFIALLRLCRQSVRPRQLRKRLSHAWPHRPGRCFV